MACWALAATLIVVPSIVPYSDMQLLPGVLLLLKWRKQFWYGGRWLKHILAATVILVLWPYAAMVLLAGVRVVAAAEFQTLWIMPLAVMPVLPVFVAAAVGCAAVLQVRTPQAARAASVKSAT
jgi:hypothetical protein